MGKLNCGSSLRSKLLSEANTSFEIYVTAKLKDDVGIVVIPYHQTYSGLVKHEENMIDKKEYSLLSKIEKMAGEDIKLLSGAYWTEKPF